MVIHLKWLFFIKATRAVWQGLLSKFEAVECRRWVIHGPYQLTLPVSRFARVSGLRV